jgi:hypothetical protein
MWLQFSQAVSENKRFRQCQQCFSWIEILPPITRSSRLYCSDVCRIRAQRTGVLRAREMHGGRKSIKEIATELGSDVDTVRRWISDEKGRE